jgi:hypothetical protein
MAYTPPARLPGTISLSSIEMARKMRARRIAQIEDALARPDETGPDWDRKRKALQRELDRLLDVQRVASRKGL